MSLLLMIYGALPPEISVEATGDAMSGDESVHSTLLDRYTWES